MNQTIVSDRITGFFSQCAPGDRLASYFKTRVEILQRLVAEIEKNIPPVQPVDKNDTVLAREDYDRLAASTIEEIKILEAFRSLPPNRKKTFNIKDLGAKSDGITDDSHASALAN